MVTIVRSERVGAHRQTLPIPRPLVCSGVVGLGSGEGLAELFMGTVEAADANGKTKATRQQVRRHAFVYVDEGQSISTQASRQGATIAEALRTGWSGGDDLAVQRGRTTRALLDSHEPLHRLKCAALLATLEGRIVGRILAADAVKPHRVQGWLTRRDTPEFWERAADVCGLYLAPPLNAVVLSIDEKTGIQAKSRKHPTQPVKPGQPERREFEYVRHGTASLMAALDVVTGKVIADVVARNDSAHFIEHRNQTAQPFKWVYDAKKPA